MGSKLSGELISYVVFGAATTALNWGVYGLLVDLAGLSVPIANAVAWIAAVKFAFYTNKIFVFKSRSWNPLLVLREGGTFFAARIVSGLAEIAGVPLLYHLGFRYALCGIEGFAAKAAVSVVIIILNYFLSKLFIFRRNER